MSAPTAAAATLTAGEIYDHLQTLLDAKEQQLQHVGSLGQHILAQRIELEERVQELQALMIDQVEDELVDHEVEESYQELVYEVRNWDADNALLSSAYGATSQVTPSNTSHVLSQQQFGYPAVSSARPTQSWAGDVEFAFEVASGLRSGLLREVRRLQCTLNDRDTTIEVMAEEKARLQESIRALQEALAVEKQEASPHLREENWNLEVTVQELRSQLADEKAAVAYFESEHRRLTEALSAAQGKDRKQHQEGHMSDSSPPQSTTETVKPEEKTATTVTGGGRWFGWFGSSSTSGQPQAQVINPIVEDDIPVDEDDKAEARSVMSVKSELEAEDFVAVEKVMS